MKIPKRLKVGGHIYKVTLVETDSDLLGGDHANWARTHLGKHYMVIDKTLPTTQQEESFIHELLHTLTHYTRLNYELSDEKEENFVKRLAPVLYATLKDNKLIKS